MFIVIPLCLSITSSIFKRFLTPRVISMSQRPVGRLILLPILSMATIPMLVSAHVDPTQFTPSAFAENNISTTSSTGIGSQGNARRGPGQGMPPGFEEAAQILGGSTEDLMNALKSNGQRPNIAAAAEKLGVTEKALRSALPQPPQHAR